MVPRATSRVRGHSYMTSAKLKEFSLSTLSLSLLLIPKSKCMELALKLGAFFDHSICMDVRYEGQGNKKGYQIPRHVPSANDKPISGMSTN